jgi:hypothetical protein
MIVALLLLAAEIACRWLSLLLVTFRHVVLFIVGPFLQAWEKINFSVRWQDGLFTFIRDKENVYTFKVLTTKQRKVIQRSDGQR